MEPARFADTGGVRSGTAAPARWRLSGWVGVVGAAQVLVFLAASMRYGYHRDELYFIVAGSHPAFGYPDQPPLVPLLCWAMHAIAPGSLPLLRTPSALAAAVTAITRSAHLARGRWGSRPQILEAACTASSGFALAVGHFVTTTTFDLVSTTAMGWLMVRAVVRESGACVLAAGVVVGVGVEAKPQAGLGRRAARAVSPCRMAPAALRPITYAALAVVYLAGNAKAYYLASLYPLLLGLGALPTSEWTIRAPKRTSLLGTAIPLSAAVSTVIALPLLPERDLQGAS